MVAVAIGLLGNALNSTPLRLVEWIGFEFGAIAYLLSAVALGPWYGAISAAIASTAAIPNPNLSAAAIAAVGAVTVGYLVRFGNLQLLSAAILSHAVTVPLTILVRASHSSEETWIAVGQTAVATILGAGLLQWLLAFVDVTHRPAKRGSVQRTFRGHLYEAFTTLGVVMVLVIAIAFARAITGRLTNEMDYRLNVAARTVGAGVHQYLSDHADAMTLLAATVDETGALWDPPRLDGWLRKLRAKYPGFRMTFSVDRHGHIITTDSRGSSHRRGVLEEGPDASKEPYFQEPRKTKRPYVSNTFSGWGATKEPLVSVSAPLRSDAGRFAGVVGGFLNVARMGDFERYSPGVEGAAITVLDRSSRVVFAAGATPYGVLSDLSGSELVRRTRDKDASATVRYVRKLTGTDEGEELVAAHSLVPGHEWTVFVEAPASLVRQELMELYGRLAVWAGIGIAVCFLLAHVVAWRYTRPLRELVNYVAQLAPGNTLARPTSDASVPAEVARLIDSFGGLSERLAHSDAELRATLQNLEATVHQRTAELEEARTRAVEASKAKSVFLATMSHEIRTPLNGVLGTIGLLEATSLTGEQREYASIALQSAESLMAILNDILDLSKIEAGRLVLESAPFELAEALESSIAPFRMLACAKGLKLRTTWPSAPLYVTGDGGRLRQVLSNLLSNAIKFTPRGSIEIEVAWQTAGAGCVHIDIAVRDTGIGISEPARHGLFKPFVQGDESTARHFGGTGLGLAISKQLVELMGGDINVESQPDVGSCFRFSVILPLARDEWTPRHPARTEQLRPGSLLGTRVLLVEDNPVNRLVATRLLAKLGCQVVEATTGREAVAACAEDSFDLILMDCQMPEVDGYEATRRIRDGEVVRRTPIVAMTANAMSGDKEKCFEAGMDDFIPKPVHPTEVAETLGRVLGLTPPQSSCRAQARA